VPPPLNTFEYEGRQRGAGGLGPRKSIVGRNTALLVFRALGCRHLGRDEGPTSWGAIVLICKAIYGSCGVQALYPFLYPSFSIGRVFKTTVLRRVYDRHLYLHFASQCRESFIVRHDYSTMSRVGSPSLFEKCILFLRILFCILLNAYSYIERPAIFAAQGGNGCRSRPAEFAGQGRQGILYLLTLPFCSTRKSSL